MPLLFYYRVKITGIMKTLFEMICESEQQNDILVESKAEEIATILKENNLGPNPTTISSAVILFILMAKMCPIS